MRENANQSWIPTLKQLLTGSQNVRSLKTSIDFEINNFLFFLDGDLGAYGDAKAAYMKQKHRLIWERRHGPVGSGMRGQDQASESDE